MWKCKQSEVKKFGGVSFNTNPNADKSRVNTANLWVAAQKINGTPVHINNSVTKQSKVWSSEFQYFTKRLLQLAEAVSKKKSNVKQAI